MTKEKDYWFKAKRYGWGWGLPRTWQGWVSFGVFIAVWLWALTLLVPPVEDTEISPGRAALFVLIMVMDVAGLVYVSLKHGEPPKWRWGDKTKSKQKD
jgi:hypothetical protein